MSDDPDATVLLPPRTKRPVYRIFAAGGALAACLGLGGLAWFEFVQAPAITPVSSQTPVPSPVPATVLSPVPPQAVVPASAVPVEPPAIPVSSPVAPPKPAPPPLVTEAQILARAPTSREVYRFAAQPAIVVLQFATLADQAGMLNRMAALIEKAGFPRDRILAEAELDRMIRANGEQPDTFYLGHDYRAADLLQFFAMAGRAGMKLTPQETWLQQAMQDWGWQPGITGALISLVRETPADGLDQPARAAILRHELSHGAYFTQADYAAFAAHFWADALTRAEREAFRRFLRDEGYDTGLNDLVINETQAYLMHTADRRFFVAAAVGMTTERLDMLRGLFLTGMPPGWLRDCTTQPPR